MNRATAVRNILLAIIFAALFCLVMAAVSIRARAQAACGPYQAIVFSLKAHGESLVFQGVASDGKSVLLAYASAKSHTWTVLITVESGLACLIAAGTDSEVALPSDPS